MIDVGHMSPAAYSALLIGRSESDRYHYIQRARADFFGGMRKYYVHRARLANHAMLMHIRHFREVTA